MWEEPSYNGLSALLDMAGYIGGVERVYYFVRLIGQRHDPPNRMYDPVALSASIVYWSRLILPLYVR